MIKNILIGLLLVTLLSPRGSYAYMYDGQEDGKQIIIDKEIKHPEDDDWKDNLSADVRLFTAETPIDFKLVVKNSGDSDLHNIVVKDNLPDYVNFIFGSANHEISDDRKEIRWDIEKLEPGEQTTYTIRAAIVDVEKLPNSKRFSVINKARVETDDIFDEDTAQFFIETRILASTLPESGVDLVSGTLAALSVTALGIFIRKFGRSDYLGA